MLSLLPFLSLLPLLTSTPVSALPLPRAVGTETCTTLTSGVLSGGALADHPQNFFIWDNVLYYGGSDGLEVEFQRCDPNFEGFPQNSTLITGHIYVPSLSACLAVDPPNGAEPHTLTAEPCTYSEDSGQILQQWWWVNGASGVEYVWAGFTDNRGNVQNADTCSSGTFGYAVADLASPPTEGVAQIVCTSDEGAQPFRIIPQA
ncbi:hypothetical protein CALVIDRAFT_568000 [Calocera viscosa TUFC12733]|uniref:Ricin B lectin domain-containing protein n=1 Tax=Calocera viscosa (strain TUFC12733) TaxID=1330018 RepID=A0A167HJ38_CALVF|nr:hypothetical protein CALVIDRAFT_568000 [Calocera viscosa TUFC12733]